ncbi:MAG: hypothetical protein JO286_14875 [Solirubrobacterales bacterium]|nr:hypothetical protein [Solirubrobacterales bacterium]
MWVPLDVLLIFVALYPVVTAALWVAGGIMFKLLDEHASRFDQEPPDGCPEVSVMGVVEPSSRGSAAPAVVVERRHGG